MDGYIKLTDLALLLVAAAAVVSAVFLIIFLKNLTDCLKIVKTLLKDNKANIDESLKNIPSISNNIKEASEVANREIRAVESAICSFGTAAEETATAFVKIKKDFAEVFNLVSAIKFIKALLKKKER
jgi:flagellar motor component MotA